MNHSSSRLVEPGGVYVTVLPRTVLHARVLSKIRRSRSPVILQFAYAVAPIRGEAPLRANRCRRSARPRKTPKSDESHRRRTSADESRTHCRRRASADGFGFAGHFDARGGFSNGSRRARNGAGFWSPKPDSSTLCLTVAGRKAEGGCGRAIFY